MKQINKASFKSEVSDFKGVVIADFYADWCAPCRMLSPLMEEMDRENKSPDVKFVKVNVDEEQELAMTFNVMSIPTVIFFKDGKKVHDRIGVSSKGDYQQIIKSSQRV